MVEQLTLNQTVGGSNPSRPIPFPPESARREHSGSGGIGRRAGFRSRWEFLPWGFKSLLPQWKFGRNLLYSASMSEAPPSSLSPTPLPYTLDKVSAEWLTHQLIEIEKKVDKDVIVIQGGISYGVDTSVRMALERLEDHRDSSLVLLSTPGGIVEVVERISSALRHFYKSVDFLIPDQAMSAGTVLALSGDAIWMDYFSRLGPIDPQVLRGDGQLLVPGLSYLHQYEALISKSGLVKRN